MYNGWIKLHRKLIENPIFDNEKGLKVWLWCLFRAGHQKNTILLGRQKVTLNAGEFAMGSKKESEILKIAKSTLWFWLEYLAREGQLELKKTTKYTVIKVKNWKKYQLLELKSDSNEDADGTQIGTNNNVKKVKNKKNTFSADKPRKDNNVHLLVNRFFELKGWNNLPKEEYKKRQIIYGRFTKPAKELLELTDGNYDIACKKLEIVKKWADTQEIEWGIETVFKRWFDLDVLPQEKKKRPKIEGNPAYQKRNKWFVIMPNGEHKEYVGPIEKIQYA